MKKCRFCGEDIHYVPDGINQYGESSGWYHSSFFMRKCEDGSIAFNSFKYASPAGE